MTSRSSCSETRTWLAASGCTSRRASPGAPGAFTLAIDPVRLG